MAPNSIYEIFWPKHYGSLQFWKPLNSQPDPIKVSLEALSVCKSLWGWQSADREKGRSGRKSRKDTDDIVYSLKHSKDCKTGHKFMEPHITNWELRALVNSQIHQYHNVLGAFV